MQKVERTGFGDVDAFRAGCWWIGVMGGCGYVHVLASREDKVLSTPMLREGKDEGELAGGACYLGDGTSIVDMRSRFYWLSERNLKGPAHTFLSVCTTSRAWTSRVRARRLTCLALSEFPVALSPSERSSPGPKQQDYGPGQDDHSATGL
ncbi:hypothetical protein CC78DRAFT_615911 [Lojkania enalia]|uniref:Uncharacterized protein n=1 Tax=Lojkania enalia TaxID=147567 RepID=A0A9P4N8M3_9PLEO|nr:hypothetical protein CC78DRAFT_615911 [Didymosphaeria enalia]